MTRGTQSSDIITDDDASTKIKNFTIHLRVKEGTTTTLPLYRYYNTTIETRHTHTQQFHMYYLTSYSHHSLHPFLVYVIKWCVSHSSRCVYYSVIKSRFVFIASRWNDRHNIESRLGVTLWRYIYPAAATQNKISYFIHVYVEQRTINTDIINGKRRALKKRG